MLETAPWSNDVENNVSTFTTLLRRRCLPISYMCPLVSNDKQIFYKKQKISMAFFFYSVSIEPVNFGDVP